MSMKSIKNDNPQTLVSKTILIIEDIEATRELLILVIGERYRYLEAGTSTEGLEFLRYYKPDIVIADLIIPDANGKIPTIYQACRIVEDIRQIDQQVKLVINSVFTTEKNIRELLMGYGADICLSKLNWSPNMWHKILENLTLDSRAKTD